MPLRSYKPTSPGRRFVTRSTFEEITTDKPHKPLLEPQEAHQRPQQPGPPHRPPSRRRREARTTGASTSSATSCDVPARLATVEYDPNRSARIGLLHYRDGEKRYMLVPNGLNVGDIVVAGPRPRRASATRCRSRTSRSAPRSTTSSSCPGKRRPDRPRRPARRPSCWPRKATTPRSACRQARFAGSTCAAWRRSARSATSITRTRASARPAARRHMGRRPEVRGVAMNPRDHPHGGGEGKSPTGMPPKTPWGQPAMGHRTRRNKTHRAVTSSAPGTARASREEVGAACHVHLRRARSSRRASSGAFRP